MLSQTMINQLNKQINLEFYSSNLYLQMSAWCDHKSLEGSARFLYQHAQEEMGHMQRLFTYVNETGALALIGSIASPPTEFSSITDIFEQTYQHEQTVTQAINELAHTAFSQKDYSTFNFLQWYVAEQHEEERLFKSILDKIELIGDDRRQLFFLDREIGELANSSAESPSPAEE